LPGGRADFGGGKAKKGIESGVQKKGGVPKEKRSLAGGKLRGTSLREKGFRGEKEIGNKGDGKEGTKKLKHGKGGSRDLLHGGKGTWRLID